MEIRHHRFTFTVKQIKYADDSYRLWLEEYFQDVFKDYPSNEKFDLSIVYETLSEKKDLACFESEKRFYEIGSIEVLKN